jgi:RNA polymerase sigma factor (sigma-70 family)
MGSSRNLAPLASAAIRCQPDSRLVMLTREGHEQAFAEIVRRYRSGLVGFAAAIVSPNRAEDVVQDALMKAYAALPSSDAEIQLRPWLYTIVRNRALNVLRDNREHEHLDENYDGVPQPPDVAARREELAALVGQVKALPEAQRKALVQRELEGRSHAEIANTLGATPGAVRGLIFRARTSLRDATGMLIPPPLLRMLLNIGAPGEAAGAGGAGGTAALLTGSGGGVVFKAGGALVIGALALGGGVALRDHAGGHGDTTTIAEARHAMLHRGHGHGLSSQSAGRGSAATGTESKGQNGSSGSSGRGGERSGSGSSGHDGSGGGGSSSSGTGGSDDTSGGGDDTSGGGGDTSGSGDGGDTTSGDGGTSGTGDGGDLLDGGGTQTDGGGGDLHIGDGGGDG